MNTIDQNNKAMTLNEKILSLINKHSNVIDEAGNCAVDDFSYNDLADTIEKLIFLEKIDLLNQIKYSPKPDKYLSGYIAEITEQLNQLTKQQ